jgi:hypothetical protein
LWALEGVWDRFQRYLPSSLSGFRRELHELTRVHGTAFRGSSPYSPLVQEGELCELNRVHGPLSVVPPLILQFEREPCGLERAHGNAFRGTSPHSLSGYRGSILHERDGLCGPIGVA